MPKLDQPDILFKMIKKPIILLQKKLKNIPLDQQNLDM